MTFSPMAANIDKFDSVFELFRLAHLRSKYPYVQR